MQRKARRADLAARSAEEPDQVRALEAAIEEVRRVGHRVPQSLREHVLAAKLVRASERACPCVSPVLTSTASSKSTTVKGICGDELLKLGGAALAGEARLTDVVARLAGRVRQTD